MASDENNKNNREDCPDQSQAEMSRLRSEIRELGLKLEKANDKLTKEKNELESERENSKTLRKFIHELNKVQLLERSPPPPPPSPLNASIQSPQTPAMHLAVSGEFVQKLVMDKTGLESQMCGQKREIELLKSKLTQSADTQQQRHTDLLLKEQQLEECKSDYLKLDTECQLGKQLFKEAQNALFIEKAQLQQEVDRERDLNKNFRQKIEENNKQHLSEVREKDTSISKLANQLETLQTQFGRERDEILKRKESELFDLKLEFERTETELRHEVEQQKQELEGYQALCSKQEETADPVGSLISEKSGLEQSIEELKQQNQKLTTEAAQQPDRLTLMGELDTANDRIMKLEQTSLAKEEQLSGKIQELWNGNMELTANINTLNKQILEQNKQITSARGAHEAKEKSLSLHKTKDKQISDLKIQILGLQEKEKSYQILKRSSGATPGATSYDFTSYIVPVANRTGKSASKLLIRTDKHVNVVKLRSLPNPNEYIGRQAILSINKHNELGAIMVIFELPGRLGLKSVSPKYVGIKLYKPVGNSGGEFRTKRYFQCEPNYGIFAPIEDVFIPVV